LAQGHDGLAGKRLFGRECEAQALHAVPQVDLGAFLSCVEARVPDYWAPMGSTAIIGAVVDLIGARLALGAEKRSWLLYLALRGYSLSPTFWQRLEQQEAPDEIPELAPAW
jgi:hypothetical protein